LIAHPHVVATPHIAASTVEAQADVGVQIARQVLAALRGENYQNSVNVQQVQDGWRTKCPNAIC
jgi:D-3-phosphoglycerate dehydrogenase